MVTGNTAGLEAGGICNQGTFELVDSTVTANVAGRRAGGIRNDGTLSLLGSTVTANVAGRSGGGIWNRQANGTSPGVVTLDGTSSVTGNTPDDCVGTPAC